MKRLSRIQLLTCLCVVVVLLPGLASALVPTYKLVNAVRITPSGQYFMHPVWSPDGKWVAVTKAKYRGIYLVDPSGRDTTITELTSERSAGFFFRWSKDGKKIIYSARGGCSSINVATRQAETLQCMRPGGTRAIVTAEDLGGTVAYADSLMRLYVETQGKARLLADDGQYIWPSSSPAGDRVLAAKVGGKMYVFVIEDTAGTVRRIESGEGRAGVWSPDGKKILFHVAREDDRDIVWSELYLVNSDGTGRVQLTDTPGIREMNPCWSPDGSKVAFDDQASGAICVAELKGGD